MYFKQFTHIVKLSKLKFVNHGREQFNEYIIILSSETHPEFQYSNKYGE